MMVDVGADLQRAFQEGYEKGRAESPVIYGNEHNCIMTIFGECSYAETGCGDCAVVEMVRKALNRPQLDKDIVEPIGNGNVIMSEDTYEELLEGRPQGEWKFSSTFTDSWGSEFAKVKCSHCGYETFAISRIVKDGNYCVNCGCRMKGAGDE